MGGTWEPVFLYPLKLFPPGRQGLGNLTTTSLLQLQVCLWHL